LIFSRLKMQFMKAALEAGEARASGAGLVSRWLGFTMIDFAIDTPAAAP